MEFFIHFLIIIFNLQPVYAVRDFDYDFFIGFTSSTLYINITLYV